MDEGGEGGKRGRGGTATEGEEGKGEGDKSGRITLVRGGASRKKVQERTK